MPFLDRPTLIVITALVALVLHLVTTGMWLVNRDVPGVRNWSLGVGAASLALMLQAMAHWVQWDLPTTVIVASSLIFFALLLQLDGSLAFTHNPLRLGGWGYAVPTLGFVSLLTLLRNDHAALSMARDTCLLLTLLTSAAVMVLSPFERERPISILIAMFLLAMGAALGVRILAISQMPAHEEAFAHPVSTLVYLMVIVFLLGWSYCVNIAALQRARHLIHDLTRNDAVTGLPKAEHMEEVLSREVAQSQRSGTAFCYLLIDMNDFTRVNELYGRSLGNAVLHELGERLKNHLRAADFVCHLSGDRFAVMLHHTPDPDHLRGAISRLRRLLAQPVSVTERAQTSTVQLQAHMGMAVWPTDGETADQLRESAYRRMQAEKDSPFQPWLEQAASDSSYPPAPPAPSGA